MWRGLDRYGNVFDSINWENGPRGLYIHSIRLLNLNCEIQLVQAKNKRKKAEKAKNEENTQQSTVKRASRSTARVLHHSHLCVWCMEGKTLTCHVNRFDG